MMNDYHSLFRSLSLSFSIFLFYLDSRLFVGLESTESHRILPIDSFTGTQSSVSVQTFDFVKTNTTRSCGKMTQYTLSRHTHTDTNTHIYIKSTDSRTLHLFMGSYVYGNCIVSVNSLISSWCVQLYGLGSPAPFAGADHISTIE